MSTHAVKIVLATAFLLSTVTCLAQDLWTSERRAGILAIRAFKPGASQPERGTAFLVTNTGFILTAAHVVRGATRVEVSLDGPGGPWMEVAEKPQEDLGYDVALLKAFSSASPGAYRPLPLGAPSSVARGHILYFAGYPFAREFDARRAEVTSESGLEGGLQADANAAGGFSGAPVLNQFGTVIGIISSGAAMTPGFLQIVPLSRVRPGLDRYEIEVPRVTATRIAPPASAVASAPTPPIASSPPPRVTAYQQPQPLSLPSAGRFQGRGWKYDVFYCAHGEGNPTLARQYANNIADVLRQQPGIGRLQVKPWKAPGTIQSVSGVDYVYNVYYDFDIRVTDERMEVAVPLKELLDPVIKLTGSRFEFLEVGSHYPNYISMVICPR